MNDSNISCRSRRHRRLDGVAVVAGGYGEVVVGLEVYPDLGAGAEIAGEAERGVGFFPLIPAKAGILGNAREIKSGRSPDPAGPGSFLLLVMMRTQKAVMAGPAQQA